MRSGPLPPPQIRPCAQYNFISFKACVGLNQGNRNFLQIAIVKLSYVAIFLGNQLRDLPQGAVKQYFIFLIFCFLSFFSFIFVFLMLAQSESFYFDVETIASGDCSKTTLRLFINEHSLFLYFFYFIICISLT